MHKHTHTTFCPLMPRAPSWPGLPCVGRQFMFYTRLKISWLICMCACVRVWRARNKERVCITYCIPFSPFLSSFSHHTWVSFLPLDREKKMKRCQTTYTSTHKPFNIQLMSNWRYNHLISFHCQNFIHMLHKTGVHQSGFTKTAIFMSVCVSCWFFSISGWI